MRLLILLMLLTSCVTLEDTPKYIQPSTSSVTKPIIKDKGLIIHPAQIIKPTIIKPIIINGPEIKDR